MTKEQQLAFYKAELDTMQKLINEAIENGSKVSFECTTPSAVMALGGQLHHMPTGEIFWNISIEPCTDVYAEIIRENS